MLNSTLHAADFTDSEATRTIQVARPQNLPAGADQLDRSGLAVIEPVELPFDHPGVGDSQRLDGPRGAVIDALVHTSRG